VPTDTVTLEDVYTGQVRVVANVPLGVAVPMSVISSMGVADDHSIWRPHSSTPTEAGLLQNGYLKCAQHTHEAEKYRARVGGLRLHIIRDAWRNHPGLISKIVVSAGFGKSTTTLCRK